MNAGRKLSAFTTRRALEQLPIVGYIPEKEAPNGTFGTFIRLFTSKFYLIDKIRLIEILWRWFGFTFTIVVQFLNIV
jgi:hypothetical protein